MGARRARSVAQLEANLDSLALELSDAQRDQLDQVSTPSLNFPADNNARFGPMLAFGGMTIDGVAIGSRSIAAKPATR